MTARRYDAVNLTVPYHSPSGATAMTTFYRRPQSCLVITLLAFVGLALAGDTPSGGEVKWPDAIVQADKRYEEAVAAANAARLRVYQREMEQATRRADLPLANAIKERMEGVGDVKPTTTAATAPRLPATFARLNTHGDRIDFRLQPDGTVAVHTPGRSSSWRTWSRTGARLLVGDAEFEPQTLTVFRGVGSDGVAFLLVPVTD
jgi:hypothetical protein